MNTFVTVGHKTELSLNFVPQMPCHTIQGYAQQSEFIPQKSKGVNDTLSLTSVTSHRQPRFHKEWEGPALRHPHICSHDTLIVKPKDKPQLDWVKVRPRAATDNPSSRNWKYKMCAHFQNNQPCRIGEAKCTFIHNPVEERLWNLDRERVFSIEGFINDAKRQGICKYN